MVDWRELARGKKNTRRGRKADGDRLSALKRAAELAAEAIVDMMADESQFCRHTYADKSSGAIMETTLESRNVKQIRETIQAIRDLADTVRSLNGLLSPEQQSELDVQMAKIRMEERKLSSDGAQNETGVVLLPEPDGGTSKDSPGRPDADA